jgi:hypothetical protein
MLSRENLEAYRRMTPDERLALSLKAMDEAWPYLLSGPRDLVERRFAAIRRENDARNLAMLTKLAEASRGQP